MSEQYDPSHRFRFEEVLGWGDRARVYSATDNETAQKVVVKLLTAPERLPWEDVTARFYRAIEILRSVQHPAVAPILADGVSLNGEPFFVTPLFRGKPIAESRLTAKELLGALLRVLEALEACALHGLCHLNLTPDNVLIDSAGIPCLVGWRSTLLVEPEPGMPLPGGMTNAFSAPELRDGRWPRSALWKADLFSISSMAATLMGAGFDVRQGRLGLLFDDDLAKSLHQPEDLRRLLERGLDPAPESRPSSYTEVGRGIQSAVPRTTAQRPTGETQPMPIPESGVGARTQVVQRIPDPASTRTMSRVNAVTTTDFAARRAEVEALLGGEDDEESAGGSASRGHSAVAVSRLQTAGNPVEFADEIDAALDRLLGAEASSEDPAFAGAPGSSVDTDPGVMAARQAPPPADVVQLFGPATLPSSPVAFAADQLPADLAAPLGLDTYRPTANVPIPSPPAPNPLGPLSPLSTTQRSLGDSAEAPLPSAMSLTGSLPHAQVVRLEREESRVGAEATLQPAKTAAAPAGTQLARWRPWLVAAAAVFLSSLGLIAIWSSDGERGEGQIVGEASPALSEVVPPPPEQASTPVLPEAATEAAEALSRGDFGAARKALSPLLAPEVAGELPIEQWRALRALDESITLTRREWVVASLEDGVRRVDVAGLRRALAVADSRDLDQLGLDPEVDALVGRASRWVRAAGRFEESLQKGTPSEALDLAAALESESPLLAVRLDARRRAGDRIEAGLEQLVQAGRFDEAREQITQLRDRLADPSRLNPLNEVIADAQHKREGGLRVLRSAEEAGRRGRPHEGLALLRDSTVAAEFPQRTEQVRSTLQTQLEEMDSQAPRLEMVEGQSLEVRKGQTVIIEFRVSDDYEVVAVTAQSRNEQGAVQDLSAQRGSDGAYRVEIEPGVHGDRPILFWAAARDRSGNVGKLASAEQPIEIRRPPWLQRTFKAFRRDSPPGGEQPAADRPPSIAPPPDSFR